MKIDYVSASEFCDSVRDGTHDTPKQVDYGFKLVTSKCIRDGIIDVNEAYYISESDYNKICERSKVEQWDVLMGMIGNGLGRTAVVNRDADYAIKNIALFKIGNEIKAKWLHYYLSSPMGQGEIFNALQGSGQPFISLRILRNFPVPKADDTKMAKVVSVLSAYDNLIENNQKQIKLLEEAAQLLYREWFVDLRFPGHENVKIVDGVPEGWSKGVINDVVGVLRRGITPKYNEKGKYTVINQKCIRTAILDFQESRKQEKAFDSILSLHDGDTVICSTGLGTLGRVGKVYGSYPEATIDSHVTLIRAKETISNHYLYHSLKYLQSYFMSMGRGSTQQQELYRQVIEGCKILLPDKGILDKYQNVSEAIHRKIFCLVGQLRCLQEARDRLLPKLMSGEIEV